MGIVYFIRVYVLQLFSQILILCNSSVLKFNTFVRPHGSDGIVLASYGVGGKRLVRSCEGNWGFIGEWWIWRGGNTYVCITLGIG